MRITLDGGWAASSIPRSGLGRRSWPPHLSGPALDALGHAAVSSEVGLVDIGGTGVGVDCDWRGGSAAVDWGVAALARQQRPDRQAATSAGGDGEMAGRNGSEFGKGVRRRAGIGGFSTDGRSAVAPTIHAGEIPTNGF